MNSQPHTLSNTVSDEHVPSPLPALPSPASTKFGEGVSLLGVPLMNAPIDAPAVDVEMEDVPPATLHPNVAALPPAPPAQQPPAPPAQQPPARPAHFFGGNFSDDEEEFDNKAGDTSHLARQIGFKPSHVAIYGSKRTKRGPVYDLFPFRIHFTPPNGKRVNFGEFLLGVRYGIDNGYVNEGATVDLSFLASKSAPLANAIDCANSMGYPEGEFAVIEKSYARSKTHAGTLHTTFIVSLKTCQAFHGGKNPHKKMCDEMDIDLYSIQSETLVRQLQDAASHGLPPFWLLDNTDTDCHVTSPDGDVMKNITKALEICNVSQPDYLREVVVTLQRMRQQKRTSFFNDYRDHERDWSSASVASYPTLGRLLRGGTLNYEHLKDLIKYINSSVTEDEYAGCADLAGLMFCLNKRLRVGNAVPDDALSTDVRLGSLNIGVIELDKVGRDGVIYHPLYSDQAEYESMDGGSDYSGLTEGTIVVAKINSLVDGNDDAIDESNGAFMLLRYLGCYVDDDDKLFIALTVPTTNEDGEDDEYYLIAGEDEDLEDTVNHNLFIFTLPGTSLPFYDEEGGTVHVSAEV